MSALNDIAAQHLRRALIAEGIAPAEPAREPAVYSPAIDRLEEVAALFGYRVERYADLPADVSGRCHYPNSPGGPLIELGCVDAREALCALAHELGHAMADAAIPGYQDEPYEVRELLAMDFGGRELATVGSPITRLEWARSNAANFREAA